MLKVLVCICVLVTMVGTAQGRYIENWPYDRLLREADVVVVASLSADTVSDVRPQGQLAKMNAVAHVATFDVHLVLKGDPGKSVDLLYVRLPENLPTINGPLLAHFRKDGPTIQPDSRNVADKAVVKLSKPGYLLFLKRTEGGRLEPVSGQFDSELSVREIYTPLPEVVDGRH